MSKPNTWYSILRKTAVAAAAVGVVAAAEIWIYGDIGESWWAETVSARSFITELNDLDADAITVRINSMGGSVPDGLAIVNAMRRHKATITTEVDGMAFSCASMIAMGGDKVNMAANAMLMIHAPWTGVAGNANDLRDMADQLDTWAAAMATSYAHKTGDQAAMLALMADGRDHYFTADEALAAGYIDAITDASPVAASASRTLPLSRYRSLPEHLQTAAPSAAAAASPDLDEELMNRFRKNPLLLNALAGAAALAAGGVAPTNPVAPNPTAPDAAAILAAETQRRTEIRAAFTPFAAMTGMAELQRECEDNTGCTVAAAHQRLLAQLGSGTTPVAGAHVQTVEDETDKFRGAVEQSILARAGATGRDGNPVRADASNPYRGQRLSVLASMCATRGGRQTAGLDEMQIVGMAFTQGTSDFPIILQNVMHKAVQTAYVIAPDTWSKFCKRGSVSDFRPHNRYRIGSLSNLEALNELGEFKNKVIPDGEKASITAGTKGNLINISRQAVINDDLGALVGLSEALGRAARRTVEADVYALLALNSGAGPTMPDGNPLFHASHGNLIASGAGAPSTTQLDAMRVLMGQQKDVSNNDFLDLAPAVLLVPLSLGGAARVAVFSEYDPDTNSKLQRVNIARNLVSEIVDTPRLSGTGYTMFADPNSAPVIEVVFLGANDVPFLDQQQGWTVDGTSFKVRLDYGVGAIDFKGAVRNPGA